jgi:hypothetical protein
MLTAGVATVGTCFSTAAFAQASGGNPGPDGGLVTSGSGSVAGGNQVSVPVAIPASVCGNAAAVLGVATAACQGGASAVSSGGGKPGLSTGGSGSVAGGNQVSVPVSVPVDVCGNAVGGGKSHCKGGAVAGKGAGKGSLVTSGTGSVAGGNQVSVPVKVPVDICGNSVAVLGVAGAACKGGAVAGAVSGAEHAVGSLVKGSSAITSLLPIGPQALAGLTAYHRPAVGSPSALDRQKVDPFSALRKTIGAVAKGSAAKGSAAKGSTAKGAVAKSAATHGGVGLAGLGTLPLVAGLPSLAGLSSLAGLASTPGAGALLPQTILSSASGAGMSTTSFFTLAGGVLLAGISALKLSTRRARALRGGKVAAA